MIEENNLSANYNINTADLNKRFSEVPEVLFVYYNIEKIENQYYVKCYCICNCNNIISTDLIKLIEIMNEFKKSLEEKKLLFDFTISSIEHFNELVITENSEPIYFQNESIKKKVDKIKTRKRTQKRNK